VARLTSEISTSPREKSLAGAVAGDPSSATVALVVAAVAASDNPATLRTGIALFESFFERLTLEVPLVCDIGLLLPRVRVTATVNSRLRGPVPSGCGASKRKLYRSVCNVNFHFIVLTSQIAKST
jgi:hypothetical protein